MGDQVGAVPALPAVLLVLGVLVAYWPHEATAPGPEAGMSYERRVLAHVIHMVVDWMCALGFWVLSLVMVSVMEGGHPAAGILVGLALVMFMWCAVAAGRETSRLVRTVERGR